MSRCFHVRAFEISCSQGWTNIGALNVFRVGFVVQHLDRLFVQLHAGINPAMVVGWLRPGVNRQDSLVSQGTA